MIVLLTGASGFIGRAIRSELMLAGHQVLSAVRSFPTTSSELSFPCITFDFAEDASPEAWESRLVNVDAVINAVGIFTESSGQTFRAVHTLGPQALFSACVSAGVKRVIQVSALGAGDPAHGEFLRSKAAADAYLLGLPLSAVVALPSLVYGAEGTSSRAFRLMASLPVIPVPGRGAQWVQPIHVEDLARAIAELTGSSRMGRIPLVGPEPLTLREYLAALRSGMGLRKTRFFQVPLRLISMAATLGGSNHGIPDREAIEMLERGNTADPQATTDVLKRPPRPVQEFIPPHQAAMFALLSRLAWLKVVLRFSIAAVWIVTGLLSFGVYPVEESYALLERAGIPSSWAGTLLYGGAILDMALGFATLTLYRYRLLWITQAVVILGYTLIITVQIPEYWLHPFGPVLKNLPLLAAIWLQSELEAR